VNKDRRLQRLANESRSPPDNSNKYHIKNVVVVVVVAVVVVTAGDMTVIWYVIVVAQYLQNLMKLA